MDRAEDALTELATHVIVSARRAKLTIATAESCTGGLVGHLLTEVPGSSEAPSSPGEAPAAASEAAATAPSPAPSGG